MQKKRLNNLVYMGYQKASRQEACTTYVGHQRPLEYRRVPVLGLPLEWILKSQGKISRLGEHPLSRWEFSQRGKKERHEGISLSRN